MDLKYAHPLTSQVSHAKTVMHGRISLINHDGSGLFAGIPSPFKAVRYHSLAIYPSDSSNELNITAECDGEIMGIQHKTKLLFGIQFHPESVASEYGLSIISNFLKFITTSSPKSILNIGRALDSKAKYELSLKSIKIPFSESLLPALHSKLFSKKLFSYWLDSSKSQLKEGIQGTSEYSIMGDCDDTFAIKYDIECKLITFSNGSTIAAESLFDWMSYLYKTIHVHVNNEIPFAGGFIGIFGYEMYSQSLNISCSSSGIDAVFMWADRFLIFDHVKQELNLIVIYGNSESFVDEYKFLDETEATLWQSSVMKNIEEIKLLISSVSLKGSARMIVSDEEYLHRIEEAFEQIRDGNSYELCLTTRFECNAEDVDFNSLYYSVRIKNPAPFSAFISFQPFDLFILSCSPERFIKISDHKVQMKPIKGTVKRSIDPIEDAKLAFDLAHDEKTMAENLMVSPLLI